VSFYPAQTLFEWLFITAAVAMILQGGLAAIARSGVSDTDQALEYELFGVPNRWLGTPNDIRLLRVRYFWPFRALPSGTERLPPWVRGTLLAARLAGFIFLCAISGFFVAAFVAAGA
jgi:hypothetical protein